MLPEWAVVTAARRAHIERVAALVREWGAAMGTAPVELRRWERAAWWHDALRDAELASEMDHGPLAAARLEKEGERDRGVLDAVRYHSIGYAGWDDAGKMLYLADYLEPGRVHHAAERASLRERVPRERDAVLRDVARRRVERTVHSGWPLAPETVAFWNALASR
jgi:HD superfamily phosphohydrolase YqeK